MFLKDNASDKVRQKRKTQLVHNNSNPNYNYTVSYSVCIHFFFMLNSRFDILFCFIQLSDVYRRSIVCIGMNCDWSLLWHVLQSFNVLLVLFLFSVWQRAIGFEKSIGKIPSVIDFFYEFAWYSRIFNFHFFSAWCCWNLLWKV